MGAGGGGVNTTDTKGFGYAVTKLVEKLLKDDYAGLEEFVGKKAKGNALALKDGKATDKFKADLKAALTGATLKFDTAQGTSHNLVYENLTAKKRVTFKMVTDGDKKVVIDIKIAPYKPPSGRKKKNAPYG